VSQGTKKTFAPNQLHVGDYPYVSACNAFTGSDFETVTSQPPDNALISTKFATKTYNKSQPDRVYETTCSRNAGPTVASANRLGIDVTISQYPTTKLTSDQEFILGFSNAKVDSELGGPTHFSMPTFKLHLGNKVIVVTIQGYGDRSDAQIQAIAKAAAKKIAVRINSGQDLAVLSYPKSVVAPHFAYRNACALWGTDNFLSLFGPGDEANIDMSYSESISADEEVQGIYNDTRSTCVIGSFTQDPGDLRSKDYAYVDADYYQTAALARAALPSLLGNGEPVAGIGDQAVLQGNQLLFLTGNAIFSVKYIPHANADNPKVQSELQTMDQTILSHLK
jgi:hypothetical protein